MIVIVNYGMGNVGSVFNMLEKVGAEAVISAEPQVIEQADKLILPGVGAFDQGIRNLKNLRLIDLLQEQVVQKKKPILGICLGMQLFTRRSQEGSLPGLGWLAAETVRFVSERASAPLRTPHMGWNQVIPQREDPLFKNLEKENRFYFVHSYHLVCEEAGDVLGKTFYGYEFDSVIRHENIMGTQFHPEKSHKFGMQLLRNFVRDV